MPARLNGLSKLLLGLQSTPIKQTNLPEGYEILTQDNVGIHPSESDPFVPTTIYGDRKHLPGLRLLWSIAHSVVGAKTLHCAVVAEASAVSTSFQQTFLAKLPGTNLEVDFVRAGLSLSERFSFLRRVHQYDIVFVVLPCEAPFSAFGAEHFLRRLIAVVGDRCFVVLDARASAPIASQAKLVRRVLVDEGPIQVQFWLEGSNVLPALRNLCDACFETGPALRRALRDTGTFAMKLGAHPNWHGVAEIAGLLTERIERDHLEPIVSNETLLSRPSAHQPNVALGERNKARWSSTPIKKHYGAHTQPFVTFDGHLDQRIELAYIQFRSSVRAFLIEGPTGSGKCLVARYFCWRRFGEEPLVANVYGSTETMESILFGHKKGAFTDAVDDNAGFFGYCEKEKRPLIINETNSLSQEAQLKLLEVLQSGKYSRLGDPKPIDFTQMVIFAANEPLRDLCTSRAGYAGSRMGSGTIRPDFLQRLGAPFRLEPLWNMSDTEERRVERERLIDYFLTIHSERACVVTPHLQADAMAFLGSEHEWPGNVREMDMAMNRLVIEWNARARWNVPVDRATVVRLLDGPSTAGRGATADERDEPTVWSEGGSLDALRELRRVEHLIGQGKRSGEAVAEVFGKAFKGNEKRKIAQFEPLIRQQRDALPLLDAWLKKRAKRPQKA